MIEHTFKIIVIGDTSAGKSSFIQRFVFDRFSLGYKPTIGVDFVSRSIHYEENTIVKVLLWDIAGQERFGGMTRVYYKDAVGCLILFDLADHKTFESVKRRKDDLDSKVRLPDGSKIPCVLVGNKSDLTRDYRITTSELNALVAEESFTAYCRVSTKLNQNVSECVNILITDIIKQLGGQSSPKKNNGNNEIEKSIKIDESDPKKKKSKCVAC